MAIVVSDTSPIRALHHLGLLSILESVYREVFLPDAVSNELLKPTKFCPKIDVQSFPFVKVESPKDTQRVSQLTATLDAGESAAIVLAIEKSADYLLIDEMDGRLVAEGLGLTPVGVLSVLVTARQTGLIANVRPLIDRLTNEMNFFVSARLYQQILQRAGE